MAVAFVLNRFTPSTMLCVVALLSLVALPGVLAQTLPSPSTVWTWNTSDTTPLFVDSTMAVLQNSTTMQIYSYATNRSRVVEAPPCIFPLVERGAPSTVILLCTSTVSLLNGTTGEIQYTVTLPYQESWTDVTSPATGTYCATINGLFCILPDGTVWSDTTVQVLQLFSLENVFVLARQQNGTCGGWTIEARDAATMTVVNHVEVPFEPVFSSQSGSSYVFVDGASGSTVLPLNVLASTPWSATRDVALGGWTSSSESSEWPSSSESSSPFLYPSRPTQQGCGVGAIAFLGSSPEEMQLGVWNFECSSNSSSSPLEPTVIANIPVPSKNFLAVSTVFKPMGDFGVTMLVGDGGNNTQYVFFTNLTSGKTVRLLVDEVSSGPSLLQAESKVLLSASSTLLVDPVTGAPVWYAPDLGISALESYGDVAPVDEVNHCVVLVLAAGFTCVAV